MMMEFTNRENLLVSINLTKIDSFQEFEDSLGDKKRITVVTILGISYFLKIDYSEFKRQYRLYNGN